MSLFPAVSSVSAALSIMLLFGLSSPLYAIDAGPTVPLERYTVLANGEIEHEDGNMLGNGRFRSIDSTICDSTELDPTFDYGAISGRPICLEAYYTGYKAEGLLPRWVRSRYVYTIGTLIPIPYVIVAIAGQDPNPTITVTSQPTNQASLVGGFVFFYVNASPVEDISYQWLHNGRAVPGAVLSDILITNVTTADAGNYSVTMTTGGKKVSSKRALLKVVVPVAIKTNPRSQSVKAGRGAVFRVGVQGTPPFTYQWYWNGNAIPQATRSFYTIPHATADDAGSYAVYVGNGASFALSSNAVLAVN